METELPHREGVDGSVSYPPLPSAKSSLESPATRKEAKRSPARYLLLPCNLAAQTLLPCNTWRCVERSDETKNDSDAESCRTVTARMEAQGIVDTIWRLERKSDAVAPLGISKTENGPTTTFMTVRNH